MCKHMGTVPRRGVPGSRLSLLWERGQSHGHGASRKWCWDRGPQEALCSGLKPSLGRWWNSRGGEEETRGSVSPALV